MPRSRRTRPPSRFSVSSGGPWTRPGRLAASAPGSRSSPIGPNRPPALRAGTRVTSGSSPAGRRSDSHALLRGRADARCGFRAWTCRPRPKDLRRVGREPGLPRRVAEQALDDEDVLPLALQPAMAAMDSDLAPAARLDEGDARRVGGEDLADELVIAAVLGCFCDRIHQGAADTGAARGAIDVQGRLADSGVIVARVVVRSDLYEREQDTVALGHERQRPGFDQRGELVRRLLASLEGRDPLGDPLVVDPGHVTCIGGGCRPNSELAHAPRITRSWERAWDREPAPAPGREQPPLPAIEVRRDSPLTSTQPLRNLPGARPRMAGQVIEDDFALVLDLIDPSLDLSERA